MFTKQCAHRNVRLPASHRFPLQVSLWGGGDERVSLVADLVSGDPKNEERVGRMADGANLSASKSLRHFINLITAVSIDTLRKAAAPTRSISRMATAAMTGVSVGKGLVPTQRCNGIDSYLLECKYWAVSCAVAYFDWHESRLLAVDVIPSVYTK